MWMNQESRFDLGRRSFPIPSFGVRASVVQLHGL
jgi:hypothetical protein